LSGGDFSFPTPAGLAHTSRELILANKTGIAAIATTIEKPPIVGRKDEPAIEFQPDNILHMAEIMNKQFELVNRKDYHGE